MALFLAHLSDSPPTSNQPSGCNALTSPNSLQPVHFCHYSQSQHPVQVIRTCCLSFVIFKCPYSCSRFTPCFGCHTTACHVFKMQVWSYHSSPKPSMVPRFPSCKIVYHPPLMQLLFTSPGLIFEAYRSPNHVNSLLFLRLIFSFSLGYTAPLPYPVINGPLFSNLTL